jgi:hypothetical protein
VILYDVKRLIQKQVLINLLLGRLALSHLRLIRFPFRRLLRLAGIAVEVFIHASTQGEELLERKSSGYGLEDQEYGRGDPPRWPRDSLYPQKLALTSLTSGGRLVGIVRSRTKAKELICYLLLLFEMRMKYDCTM